METKFLNPGQSEEKNAFEYPGVTDGPDTREKTVNDELAKGQSGQSTNPDRRIVNDDLALFVSAAGLFERDHGINELIRPIVSFLLFRPQLTS